MTDDIELGRGNRRFILLEGSAVGRRRHEILRDFDLQNEQEAPTINLRFCLQGEMNARVPGFEGERHIREGNHNIWFTPEPGTKHVLRRGSVLDVVEVYLAEEYFGSLAERHPALFEAHFSSVMRKEPFRLHEGGLTITPRMKSVIRQILGSEGQGPLRRMFIEAKVVELLALQLGQYEERKEGLHRAADLSKQDVDRMQEARGRLLARPGDPPTLPELARQVGTNEFKLKRDFKAVFDNTAFGLLLDHKMARARALLLDTDRPVGDIAREVGYSHTAHFSTAFKKKHGLSPSNFRKAS